MFSSIVLAFTLASAAVIPQVRDMSAPAGYWSGLEDYNTYHERYTALSCGTQHNTTFFSKCCHPLLKTETLAANRAPECNPANLEDDCEDESSSAAPAVATPAPATPAPAAALAPAPAEDKPSSTIDHTTSASPAASSKPAAPEVNVAPTPAPAPPKPAAPAPAPPKAPAPAPAPAPVTSTVNEITGGFGTWFTQNGVAGACGTVHSDSDKVVALDEQAYGEGCVSSVHCGKTITITDLGSGHTAQGIVADCCPTCTNFGSVDMSTGLFEEFAALSVGELNIKYSFD